MKRRKKRYYDSYTAIKSHQHITRRIAEVVHNWEYDDMLINQRDHIVNRRKRSRVGYVQDNGKDSK